MHDATADQGSWLRQIVTGFFNYHAVPTNSRTIAAFRYHVVDLWRRCRQTSKVGAVCGKAARTDLCGGRVAIRVPTAIRISPTPVPCGGRALPRQPFAGE